MQHERAAHVAPVRRRPRELRELQLLHGREQRLGDAAQPGAHAVSSLVNTFSLSSSSKCAGDWRAARADQRAQREGAEMVALRGGRSRSSRCGVSRQPPCGLLARAAVGPRSAARSSAGHADTSRLLYAGASRSPRRRSRCASSLAGEYTRLSPPGASGVFVSLNTWFPRARTTAERASNDAFCSGRLARGVRLVHGMKSMKTPKSAVWIVASGVALDLPAHLPPRALAHPPHQHRPAASSCAPSGSGIRAHPRVAQRNHARACSGPRPSSRAREEAAHRRGVSPAARRRRCARRACAREQPDVGAGGRRVRPDHERGEPALAVEVRRQQRTERCGRRRLCVAPPPPLHASPQSATKRCADGRYRA